MKKIISIVTLIIINSVSFSQFEMNKEFKFLESGQMKVKVSPYYLGGASDDINLNSVYWPGGKNAFKSLSFPSVTIGGIKNGNKHAYSTNSLARLIPGKILSNGKPDNPNLEKNRVYKIRKGWETLPFGKERDEFEKDYNEWPVEDGAPWEDIDGNGIFTRGIDKPLIFGDETIWYVNNDMDTTRIKNFSLYPSNPLGLEFQSTLFSFNRPGVLGDVYFYKLKIINKSNENVDSFFIAYNYFDFPNNYNLYGNYAGYDSLLGMSYSYKSSNIDFEYSPPAAVGHLLLQGPLIKTNLSDSAYYNGNWIKGFQNTGLSSFNIQCGYQNDRNPNLFAQPFNIEELFNNFNGKRFSGKPIYDPNTLFPTKFVLPGDPITGVGWYEGNGWPLIDSIPKIACQYRILLNILGPYTIQEYDTLEIIVATIAAQGTDNLTSISELKKKARLIKNAFDSNFNLTPKPPKPIITAFPQEEKITLWWKTNAESFEEADPLIFDQQLSDTTYSFEGYIVRQHRDYNDLEGKVIAIYDKENDVSVIEDFVIINGVNVRVPVIFGNNNGLRRFITIDKNAFTNSRLYNGNPYYFSVTAYAYSKESSPTYLESEKEIIEVIPAREKSDYSSQYKFEDIIKAELVNGLSDGLVLFRIIDPNSISGDSYSINFSLSGNRDTTYYSLINKITEDTIINNKKVIEVDSIKSPVIDGFIILINDVGKDSINLLNSGIIKRSAVKSVTLNENNIIGSRIEPVSNGIDDRQGINWRMNIGQDDYEIRFTESGSEYYTTGYSIVNFHIRNDPKGKGKVPFEIWNVTKNERLMIKILDNVNRDTSWGQLSDGIWESIYAYRGNYNEPLSLTSGLSTNDDHILGEIKFKGVLPSNGETIKIKTFKPFNENNRYEITLSKANFNDKEKAKDNIDKITVFPNPYYGSNEIERGGENFIRFTGLPTEVTIRIYTIVGGFVRRLDKLDTNQFLDWDLRNADGSRVASGIYVAHLDMPGIGEKIIKLAVILGKEFLR